MRLRNEYENDIDGDDCARDAYMAIHLSFHLHFETMSKSTINEGIKEFQAGNGMCLDNLIYAKHLTGSNCKELLGKKPETTFAHISY